MRNEENKTVRKGIVRKTLKALVWFIGIWAGLILILQVVLSSRLPSDLVKKYAPGFVDGEICLGKVSASMFRHFPAVSITLEDLAVTYPAERYDPLEQAGAQGHLLHKGCGEEADTLVSVKRLSASVNIAALIAGKIRVPDVELVKPRIFAHSYDSLNANWNIFRLPQIEDEPEDGPSEMPEIILGKISLTGHPHIVYTSSQDTIFAMVDLKQLIFNGRLDTGKAYRSRIGLSLDSMFVAGRISADTLALGLDRLHIHEHHRHLDFNASAKTLLATRSFGRMQIPVEMEGTLHFPKDTVTAFAVHGLRLDVATVPITGDAHVRLETGRTWLDGNVGIDAFPLNSIIEEYAENIMPAAADIRTDAALSLSAAFKGYYDHSTGALPDLDITLDVPDSKIRHRNFPHDVRLALNAGARTGDDGHINVNLNNIAVKTTGLHLKAAGGAGDILGEDPELNVDGSLRASLDSLTAFVPDSLGIEAHGSLSAVIKGRMNMSQMNIYNFSKADLEGKVVGDTLMFRSPKDTIDMVIEGLEVNLGPETMTSRRDSTKTRRLISIKGVIDHADISYKDGLKLHAQDLGITARNAMTSDTTRINPLGGRLDAKELSLTDASAASVKLAETGNTFTIRPKRGNPKVPVLTFSSSNKRITLRAQTNRAILTDASIKASATMNTVEKKTRQKAYLDSLAKVYPDIPRDSLFRHSMAIRRAQMGAKPLPDWLSEEDFRKKDIDIRLDETLAKYWRDWDLNGDIDIRTGIVMTPYFPLRNILRGFQAHFTNDEVGIDSLKFISGRSELGAKGTLKGLKRALAGRGRSAAPLRLDLMFTSGGMDANELLSAYSAGSKFKPEELNTGAGEVSDAEFLKMVTKDTVATDEGVSPLIVLPSNVIANVKLDASEIKYSDLNISRMTADLVMKERCVQLTNTSATSNMGDIHFDGFYSTRTKKDLKTGFNLNFVDITAEKVISLMPAADTLLPMLKSFKGLLNCEIAATASLDTNMNVVMPSINGVMRISGKDLSVSDNELFRTLARKLLFKNRKEGHIEQMTVEGLIKDNTLEIFPFVLKMDRYTLAMSGVQNLDLSFRYHVSVLKSPFLIRLGIDLSGPDFDNMKFRIGKAKYKNTKIPVFSSVIDTTKVNLVTSIRNIFEKGVEAAVKENEKQEIIEEHKQEIGYVKAVDQELEALSEEEQKQLEAEEQANEAEEQANNE